MTDPGEDVAEAEAAAARALGVCLYTGPGCGAHRRCDSVAEAEAWGKAHTAARPGHRTQVWPARVDDLAVVNPIMRAIYASVVDAKAREDAGHEAILNDPDWGKTWVSPAFYAAVRERAEAPGASPDMQRILARIRPMTPMEASPDERLDPRDQPIPIDRRRGRPRRSRHRDR
jgi:hypothetical protein